MDASTTAEGEGGSLWNIPNLLSLCRLALVLVVLVLIGLEWYAPAFVLFVVAASTDWVDGYLARRLKQETAFGRQLDPLIDKLMTAGLFIFLLAVPGTGLSAWMVTVVVARELVIQWLRSLMEGQGVAFGANLAGKLKTTFQCLAIGAILFLMAWPALSDGPLRLVRDVLIWVSVLLTLYSGVAYLAGAMPRLRRTLA